MKFRSKKGQLPFIELNGEEIEHSKIIMRELGQKYDKDIDAVLNTDQRSVSHATISMIENNLMWVVACWRTKNLDQMLKGYKVNLQHALGTRIPNGILNFFFKFTYGRKVSSWGPDSLSPIPYPQPKCTVTDHPFLFIVHLGTSIEFAVSLLQKPF
jgi:hypothetical protein